MTLPAAAPATGTAPTADWNDTLRSLEHALIAGDAAEVASIAVAVTLGPVPPSLEGRASTVLTAIARLEDEVSGQMDAISRELNRLPVRTRWSAPPAPSQLDCSA